LKNEDLYKNHIQLFDNISKTILSIMTSFTTDNIKAICENNPEEICAILNSIAPLRSIIDAFTTMCKDNEIKIRKGKGTYKKGTRTPSGYNLFNKSQKDNDDLVGLKFADRSRAVGALWKSEGGGKDDDKPAQSKVFLDFQKQAKDLKDAAAAKKPSPKKSPKKNSKKDIALQTDSDSDSDAPAPAKLSKAQKKVQKKKEKKEAKKAVAEAEAEAKKAAEAEAAEASEASEASDTDF
jgi:hypothetical protein